MATSARTAALRRVNDATYAQRVSLPQLLALSVVADGGRTLDDLELALQRDHTRATRAAGALERRGLVRSTIEPGGRHRRLLTITPAGVALLRLTRPDDDGPKETRAMTDEAELDESEDDGAEDAAEQDYGAEDDEETSGAPQTGRELVDMVLANPDMIAEMTDGELDAAGYVEWMTTASPREWAAACAESGWPVDVRPGYTDLPTELQVQHHRDVLADRLTRARERGDYL